MKKTDYPTMNANTIAVIVLATMFSMLVLITELYELIFR